MCESGTSFSGTSTSKESTKYAKLSSKSKCPEGFVGWVVDVNPDFLMKLYMANLSSEIIDNLYTNFMGNISVKRLQLCPKGADETMKAVFSQNRSFSDHFTHEYFVVKEVETGCFVPKVMLHEMKRDAVNICIITIASWIVSFLPSRHFNLDKWAGRQHEDMVTRNLM